MARQKHPRLDHLVRQGVDPEDLDEMHYEEEDAHTRKKEGQPREVSSRSASKDRKEPRVPRPGKEPTMPRLQVDVPARVHGLRPRPR